ncbi:MAG: YicC family protein [Lachnospiraceae bacterium]|nr:YicC family protein [Lachnospiraceae bacterium]
MIRSMTGYGCGEAAGPDIRVTVEIKAVNHKYNEFNIRIPRKLSFLEGRLRNYLKESILRGKVDVSASYEVYDDGDAGINYHGNIAKAYIDAIARIAEDFSIGGSVDAASIARFPEVITLEDNVFEEDRVWPVVEEAASIAVQGFIRTRETEGEHLKADLVAKLSELSDVVEKIKVMEPRIIGEYQQKLTEKIQNLLGDNTLDESRVLTEVAIMADKICVDEELVRLSSHIKKMRDELEKSGSIGRKLDFIAQEMNREANTTLSKSDDLAVVDLGIEMKTLIEKIREQIQNIE